MTESRPVVPRLNNWGEWKPLIAKCSLEEYSRTLSEARRLSSNAATAVSLYCSFTDYVGIEFVVISTACDRAPWRQYPNELLLVPCALPEFGPTQCLYDGWMPLCDSAPNTIMRGLQTIDETVGFSTRILGGSCRWVVKYAETVTGGLEIAQVTDADHERLGDSLSRLRQLPLVIQDAVMRAVHWAQHSARQLRPTDGLLALWQALESLLLALYDNCSDIGLTVPSHPRSMSKAQRRKSRQQEVTRILIEDAADPEQAVRRAYFEAIVGIKRRCQDVLAAMLGTDPRAAQLFSTDPVDWSPNFIRNAILHQGRSATEIELACDVAARCLLVRRLLDEVISRTLRKAFAGTTVPTHSQQFAMSIGPINMLPCAPTGGFEIVGDFSISVPLLIAKGLV